MELKYMDDLSK